MQFGLTGKKTGAHAYTTAFQIASLLPLPYIITLAGYGALAARRGVFSFLFDLGCAMLPRWETVALSAFYGKAGSEPLTYFLILGFAIALGCVLRRLLGKEGKTARAVRIVLCALIAADLVLRVCTPRFSAVFGTGVSVAGFVFRLCCLALPATDLIFEKRRKETKT